MNKVFIILILIFINLQIASAEMQFAEVVSPIKFFTFQNTIIFMHFLNQERNADTKAFKSALFLKINYFIYYIYRNKVGQNHKVIYPDITLIGLSDPPFW